MTTNSGTYQHDQTTHIPSLPISLNMGMLHTILTISNIIIKNFQFKQ